LDGNISMALSVGIERAETLSRESSALVGSAESSEAVGSELNHEIRGGFEGLI
jgi:hypothetical protein